MGIVGVILVLFGCIMVGDLFVFMFYFKCFLGLINYMSNLVVDI